MQRTFKKKLSKRIKRHNRFLAVIFTLFLVFITASFLIKQHYKISVPQAQIKMNKENATASSGGQELAKIIMANKNNSRLVPINGKNIKSISQLGNSSSEKETFRPLTQGQKNIISGSLR